MYTHCRKFVAVILITLVVGLQSFAETAGKSVRRGAPSVHIGYQIPAGEKVAAFYCEVTAVEDPSHT